MPVTPAMTGMSGMSGIVGAGDGGFVPSDDPTLKTWNKTDGRVITGGGPLFLASDYGENTGGLIPALQATEARKPEFLSIFEPPPGGGPTTALRFDGADDRMDAALASIAAPATIFGVFKIPTSTGFNGLMQLGAGGGANLEASLQRGSSGFPGPPFFRLRSVDGTGATHLNDGVMTLDVWFRYIMRLNTSLPFFQLWIDGVEELYATQPAAAHNGNGQFRIGVGGDQFLEGLTRETGAMASTDTSIADLDGYLQRWF